MCYNGVGVLFSFEHPYGHQKRSLKQDILYTDCVQDGSFGGCHVGWYTGTPSLARHIGTYKNVAKIEKEKKNSGRTIECISIFDKIWPKLKNVILLLDKYDYYFTYTVSYNIYYYLIYFYLYLFFFLVHKNHSDKIIIAAISIRLLNRLLFYKFGKLGQRRNMNSVAGAVVGMYRSLFD